MCEFKEEIILRRIFVEFLNVLKCIVFMYWCLLNLENINEMVRKICLIKYIIVVKIM